MSAGPKTSVIEIGRDQRPVLIIDSFASDPVALRDVAKRSPFTPARNLYPGLRAPLPDDYWNDERLTLLESLFAEIFGLTGKINLIDSSFSIVSTPRGDLQVGQRLPHADAFRPNQLALVHYLTPHIEAGTAFYRHRSTGIENVSEGDRQAYFEAVDAELQEHGVPEPDYINGDTSMFERIGEVSGTFNRAVFYFGSQLHSGAIGADTPLSTDPCEGRLTVTGFMTVD